MNKLKHLVKTVETYQVIDKQTKACFNIVSTERSEGVHFNISAIGEMRAEALSECIELLQQLIQIDCYSAVVRNGEQKGKIKVTKNVTTSISRLDSLIKQRDSIIPRK